MRHGKHNQINKKPKAFQGSRRETIYEVKKVVGTQGTKKKSAVKKECVANRP